MAGETLRTATELLAEFPDNTAGLIDALQSRNFVVSVAVAVAFLEDDPAQVPYVIPMTDGVPVDFLATLVAPPFIGNFWDIDGNNAFVEGYTSLGVIVPAGSTRLVDGSVILNVQKAGGGQGDFEFQGTEGGVFTGSPVLRSIGAVAETIVMGGSRIVDVSLGAPISFSVTPIGHSDDLTVNDVRVTLEGIMI